jgi:hypothetical protein
MYVLIFTKFGFSWHFHENPFSGNQADTCWQVGGWMDTHGEANKRFYRVCKRAWQVYFTYDQALLFCIKVSELRIATLCSVIVFCNLIILQRN